jgi:hypothetical protein
MEGSLSPEALILFLVLAAAYLWPSIIAFRNDHPHKYGILFMNVFLGWTVVGWIAIAAASIFGCVTLEIMPIDLFQRPSRNALISL